MTTACGAVGERAGEVGLAQPRRESNRLQQLRAVLPTQVRVTRAVHPLSGCTLEATGFRRWRGLIELLVALPDGSGGTIDAAATDVFGSAPETAAATILSADGLRDLRSLVAVLRPATPGCAAASRVGSPGPQERFREPGR